MLKHYREISNIINEGCAVPKNDDIASSLQQKNLSKDSLIPQRVICQLGEHYLIRHAVLHQVPPVEEDSSSQD